MSIFKKSAFLLALVLCISCKNQTENTAEKPVVQHSKDSTIQYAQGLEITQFEGYKVIDVKNPWPGSNISFKYALVEKNTSLENPENYDAVVKIPVERIVVTSTTHIPSLEMLGEIDALVGFPSLDFISSEKTRIRISDGKVRELGQNENLNTEIAIDLSPDAIIGFAMDGNNPTFTTIQKAGIPVFYNSDWTEHTPLGKAEWIKFFGAFFDKEKEADSIFKEIESEYLTAKEIASKAKTKPTVISGAMYKDVWYMPQGDSWAAKFIDDAHGEYLWKNSKGTGSLSLNLESVLEKGFQAEKWIGPGEFTDFETLKEASMAYSRFNAFKTKEVYTYNLKKGETGGSIYFELAPNRPDLVLKDFIKILHPELIPEHKLYFFDKLK